MRLFEAIMRNGFTWVTFSADGKLRAEGHDRVERVGGFPAARFVADDAYELFWQDQAARPYDWPQLGPLRSPFDWFWIEGRCPKRIHADGTWQTVASRDAGCVVYAGALAHHLLESRRFLRGVANGPPVGAQLLIVPAYRYGARSALVMRAHALVTLDSNAVYVSHELACPDVSIGEAVLSGLADDVRCALFALSLVNCRNVGLQEAGAPRATRKRREGRGPDFRYSKVVLPGAERATPNRDRFGPSTKPLQVVRGHFKTYTADAPLYGKHVGTWWWGWHARGEGTR